MYNRICSITKWICYGFVIVESSSCVDPINYSEVMGTSICIDRIKNKLWELEGYKLQNELGGK